MEKEFKKYDVVLVEKLPEDGLTQEEIVNVIHAFGSHQELIPLEIDSLSGQSSAMGFITHEAESRIYGNQPDAFEYFIGSILADVRLERRDHIYEYDGKTLWLAREAPNT